MKNILIIGMGKFGSLLAKNLVNLNNQVMIVDKDEKKINEVAHLYTNALIGDAAKEDFLLNLDVKNFDICFVTIGDDFQSSLEITSQLKELGAKYVISKADRDLQAKFLLRNGADEIVYPARDMALKLAVKCNDSVFDFFHVAGDYNTYEIATPKKWLNKTILQVDVRNRYDVNILAIKEDNLVKMPSATYVFNEKAHLLVLGKENDVFKLLNK